MTWTTTDGPLRQGDICVVPAFPVWDVERSERQIGASAASEKFVMPRHRAMEWNSLTGTVALAVCSHDCDIENPRGRTGIVVAPLSKVPAPPDSDLYAAIMRSGDVTSRIDYGNLFPVAYSGDDRRFDAVIDFSALTSFAKAEKVIPKLVQARVLGCDDATRSAVGTKLALFFGRPYQDPR